MKKLSLLMTIIAVIVSAKQNSINVGETIVAKEPVVTVAEDTVDHVTNHVADHVAEPVELTPAYEFISLGEFRLTAYCSCSKCCGNWAKNRPVDEYGNEIVIGAAGEVLTAGYSVAVDPEFIAYGTELFINGQVYEAQDCGGAIKDNEIDVYFSDHNDALEFGVQYAEIFIRKE